MIVTVYKHCQKENRSLGLFFLLDNVKQTTCQLILATEISCFFDIFANMIALSWQILILSEYSLSSCDSDRHSITFTQTHDSLINNHTKQSAETSSNYFWHQVFLWSSIKEITMLITQIKSMYSVNIDKIMSKGAI